MRSMANMSFSPQISRQDTFLGNLDHVNRLGAIGEEDEEDEEDTGVRAGGAAEEEERETVLATDVPQCFSHFTYFYSEGRDLLCDVQGVWNVHDGFVLTDPVIHHVSRKSGRVHGRNGKTDKGLEGVRKFFATHTCNALCRRLGLNAPDLASLRRQLF